MTNSLQAHNVNATADHGYEVVVEVKSYQPHASSINPFEQNPYQRPTFSFPQRHWKAIFPSPRSSTPSLEVPDEEQERVLYIRPRLTTVWAMLYLIVEMQLCDVLAFVVTTTLSRGGECSPRHCD
jgi:hypothetical protein